MTTTPFHREVEAGDRFSFGENWQAFLSVVDDARVSEAERSLREMLGVQDLRGLRFLDVGSGSGLFSLAAARLGARVHSFDYDPASVACARTLQSRFSVSQEAWTIAEGSALDAAYVSTLGVFDIVYSWGVLHHTGAMWPAIDNVSRAVGPRGRLFLAIYNDQGARSKLWRKVKQVYCSGAPGRAAMIGAFFPYFFGYGVLADVVRGRHPSTRYSEYKRKRGMSMIHDWYDWLGGLPFEVATPGEVVDFLRLRGFAATKLKTVGNALGCNEFIFDRVRG